MGNPGGPFPIRSVTHRTHRSPYRRPSIYTSFSQGWNARPPDSALRPMRPNARNFICPAPFTAMATRQDTAIGKQAAEGHGECPLCPGLLPSFLRGAFVKAAFGRDIRAYASTPQGDSGSSTQTRSAVCILFRVCLSSRLSAAHLAGH